MESWVRKYLQDKGYKDNDIGYDVNRKTVTLQGKDFITPNRVANGMSYASNADLDRAYNGFQNNTRQQEIQSQLANLKSKLNTPFQYNPSADPSYQAALKEAKAQAKVASKGAMETMNDRGILNSTVTSDRLGQIQQQSIANVENNVLPQLMQQAYAREMDQRNALMNYMNTINSQYQQGLDNQYRQDAFDYGKQQDARQFALQESNTTGKYLSSDANDKIQQLIALKAQAEASKNPGQFKAQGDALRAAIAGMGINANALFGSGVNAQQARANLDRAYSPTRQAMESNRNFNYQQQRDQIGDQRWAAEFGADQSYRNANLGLDQQRLNMQWQDMMVGLEKEGFNRAMETWKMTGVAPEGIPGVKPGTPIYDPSVQKQQQMKAEEFKNEQMGMIDAVRTGQMNIQDAFKQIQVDKALGFYTPEQASELENTLKNFHINSYGYGPPNLQGGYQGKLGFKEQQGGGGYNNYWKTEQSAGKSKNYSAVKGLLDQAAKDGGFPQSWITPMLELTGRESSWNPKADNPTSTAYGLFQFLDSTHKDYSRRFPQWADRNNPYAQAMLGFQYVKDRYGTPEKALAFWDKNKWY